MSSVKCGVESVECGEWSMECGAWSVMCGVWSDIQSFTHHGVRSVQCKV